MNEYLFRQGFARMDTSEKLELMNSLATRYDMTFRTLQTFDRWGQSCTTGVKRQPDGPTNRHKK